MGELAGCGIEDYELVDKFRTYDDYLDSFVTDSDVFYLEDRQTARRVVELGFIHGNGDLLKRGEYLAKQRAIADYRQSLLYKGPKPLLGAGKDVKGSPLLKAIVEREQALRDGSLSTIIFIRDYNSRGQEVSGYIDLGHRLAMDEVGMEAVLQLAKRFLPQSNDLSFYNWDTHAVTSSPTANFEVLVDAQKGLLFRNTRDRKVVAVDPLAPSPGDYSTRTELDTEEYVQAVVFDHVVGKRS